MISIQPCKNVIGARITGVSLANKPDRELVKKIDQALEQYGVLIFPDQNITPRQQVDFSAELGPLEMTELAKARLADVEEIFVVGNVGKGLVSFAPKDNHQELEWHTDHIHHEVSARASLLYAKEVPEEGGDTLFACMYSAYDSLTEIQKQQYSAMQAEHSASGLERYLAKQDLRGSPGSLPKRSYKKVVRPLVRSHPDTARRALYFGNQVTVGIVGMSVEQSSLFIAELTKHACQTAFRYRHRWQVGDAVLWDNRRVLHAGTPYDVENSRRLMHRTTIRETEPIILTRIKD